MADVRDDEREVGKPLPAPPEAGAAGSMGQSVHHCLRIGQGLEARDFLQDVDGREHRAEVLLLHIGLQVHFPEDLLPTVPQRRADPVGIGQRAHHPGLLVKDRIRLGIALPHHGRDARLEDACLLPRDRLQGIPQQGTVVQADGRDHRQFRRQHIGRIQPPPEAHLNDRRIHPLIGKPFERQPRRNLEERQLLLLEIRLPLRQEVKHILLRNQGKLSFGKGRAFWSICPYWVAKRRGRKPVPSRNNPSPFTEIQKMRRGIKPDPQTTGGKSRCQQGGDGALAVGTGDMDGLESPFRMAECGAEGLHALQARFVRRTEAGLLDRRETHEYLLQQLLVGLLRKLHPGDFFDFITNLPIFGQK